MKSYKNFILSIFVFVSFFLINSVAFGITPTVNVSATPSSIQNGGTSNIYWKAADAVSCASSTGQGGAGTEGNFTTPPLTTSTSYSVTCQAPGCRATDFNYASLCGSINDKEVCNSETRDTGHGEYDTVCQWGTVHGSGSVLVNIVPPPITVNVLANGTNPATILSGLTAFINWTSTNATHCTSSTGQGGTGTEGNFTTSALTGSTSYLVTCTSPDTSHCVNGFPGSGNEGLCSQNDNQTDCEAQWGYISPQDPWQGSVCDWVQGIPPMSGTGSVTVNVNSGDVTVNAYWQANNLSTINIPTNNHTTLGWATVGLDPGHCDVYKGQLPNQTLVASNQPLHNGSFLTPTYMNPPTNSDDFTVKCFNDSTPNIPHPSNSATVYITSSSNSNPQPDLIASEPTPTAVVVGVPKIFHATITNQGDADTDYQGQHSFYNLFQIATGFDDNYVPINLTDYSAGLMDTIPGGGETNIASRSITFPSAGTYYMRACADKNSAADLGTINESIEENNCSSQWVPITVDSVPKPDLTASSPTSMISGPIEVGVPRAFSSIIENQGTADTNYKGVSSFTNLFQTSTLPNGGGTVTNYPVTPKMTHIPDGGTKVTSESITFSSVGTYYIRACADKSSQNDGSGVIVESNEGNNCSASWVTITVGNPALPDLTAGTITPIIATVGVNTTFSATISNIGNASTGASFHNFVQVSTDGVTSVDISPAVLMGTLLAGGSDTMSKTYKFTTTGTYYARVCADKSNRNDPGVITESNETNNCARWAQITVGDATKLCEDKTAVNYGLPLPCLYKDGLCLDPAANNYGQILPCTYDSKCEDVKASNYGGPLPCVYNLCTDTRALNYGKPLPCIYDNKLCTDPGATNYGGPLPCIFPIVKFCADPKALNYGSPLPCYYDQGLCLDSTATNYGGTLPCTYVINDPNSCEDANALNYGSPLPCLYNSGLCLDSSARNYGGKLPCVYKKVPGYIER